MEALVVAKERENYPRNHLTTSTTNKKVKTKKLLKVLVEVENLFKELSTLSHHILIVRILPNLFPEEEKEKIPRYEPLEVEKITLGMLKELKRVQTDLKNITEKITQTFNQEDLSWLNSDLRRKFRGEWAFAHGILKEIDRILNEVQSEFKNEFKK